MEITKQQCKEMAFNHKMIDLLVEDYEYGMAMDEEQNGFFEQTDEAKAKEITGFIQRYLADTLYEQVLEIIKNDK